MADMLPTPTDPAPLERRRPGISWAAVIGFGTLGLIWPLLRLTGLESVLGGVNTATVAFLGTSLVWVLGAGFGGVPRPVLTLTLSGVLAGSLLLGMSVVLRAWPDYGVALNAVAVIFELSRAAGFGALAGVLGGAIQKARRSGT